jgi:hypothetical protein
MNGPADDKLLALIRHSGFVEPHADLEQVGRRSVRITDSEHTFQMGVRPLFSNPE